MIGDNENRDYQGLSVTFPQAALRMRLSRTLRGVAPWLFGGVFMLIAAQASRAQTSTVYSYDGSNRVIQAISSSGAGVQYQYDAAGNALRVTPVSAEALANDIPDALTFSAPATAQLLSFTLATEQEVTLSDSSLALSGSGASVMFNVYNSAGSLVGSYSSSTASDLVVSGLAPGTYSVIVVPSTDTTGSVVLNLSTSSVGAGGEDTDGPIPLWANLLMGAALLGLGGRAARRRSAP